MEVILLILIVGLVLGGGETYETPKAGTYPVNFVLAEDAEKVKAVCKTNDAAACAYDQITPCIVVLPQHGWTKESFT